MIKYLVTIEFRYLDKSASMDDSTNKSTTTTIGVYDNFDLACIEGNRVLETLEYKYKLNSNYNRRERLSLTGGCFNGKNSLISNLGYLITPFDFYLKITTLKHDNIETVLNDVESSISRYKEYKALKEE